VSESDLKLGGFYNWISQPERLKYIGKKGSWHQFTKVDDPWSVWSEVLADDLHMLEATKGN